MSVAGEAAPDARRSLAGSVCVVTGGLGFIGSNVVHRLVAAGANVRVIDALVPTHGGDVRNVNGVAKLAGEQMHMVYARAHGMRITSLRLTNVYGPRQRLSSDELGFLPVFVRTALVGGVIQLFGDGSQRRDCLHVDDVVDAMLTAAGSSDGIGRVYNVGHDVDHSLAEIAAILARITLTLGLRPISIETTPWPDDQQRIDIGSFRTDSALIAAELGWKATTDLADGLRDSLAFYRERPWYLSST